MIESGLIFHERVLMQQSRRKFLVIQLRQLGDILLTTPVIRAIKNHDPSIEVDVMTYPMGRLIIPGNHLVNHHLVAPQTGVVAALKFANVLFKTKYDVVIDFMATPRSAVMTKLIRANTKIAFDTNRRSFYSQVVARGSGDDYIVREKFHLLEAVGIVGQDVRLMLPWEERDNLVIHEFMAANPRMAQSKRRVILSPTHRRAERKWSMEAWADLAVWLETSENASVIWSWGPGEQEEVVRVHELAGGAGLLMPKTTFRELAGFTAACDLFIGNSNGPSHVAVAVNTPSLQLHGPTRAQSWCPCTSRHRSIQGLTMQDIGVDQVKLEIKRMWPLVDEGSKNLRDHLQNNGHLLTSDTLWDKRPTLD